VHDVAADIDAEIGFNAICRCDSPKRRRGDSLRDIAMRKYVVERGTRELVAPIGGPAAETSYRLEKQALAPLPEIVGSGARACFSSL